MKRPRKLHRNYVRARQMYNSLILTLGGRCAQCGDDGTNAPLEVDHTHGRNWVLNREAWHMRVRRYWLEFLRGVELRCLCKSCNSGYHPGCAESEAA